LNARIGGIYALERIARDSARDHWPVMEVLTAYAREHAHWSPRSEPDQSAADEELASDRETAPTRPRVREDIQAIMTVLGRRNTDFDAPGLILKLQDTNLSRIVLWEGDLAIFYMGRANFENAILTNVNLAGAGLTGEPRSRDLSLCEYGGNVSRRGQSARRRFAERKSQGCAAQWGRPSRCPTDGSNF
jgi:hypothetical protein